ncbi:MAG: hypothetical protein JNL97_16775 [Verrucomicrobiales bacterium]|nr:hypothetical protein [Verrucomicrobiales bacterium]
MHILHIASDSGVSTRRGFAGALAIAGCLAAFDLLAMEIRPAVSRVEGIQRIEYRSGDGV